MVSTKEYLDFVIEQLSGLDEISSRAMMEEFLGRYLKIQKWTLKI